MESTPDHITDKFRRADALLCEARELATDLVRPQRTEAVQGEIDKALAAIRQAARELWR